MAVEAVEAEVYTVGDLRKLIESCDDSNPVTIGVIHDEVEYGIRETYAHRGGLNITIKPVKERQNGN